MQFVSPVLMREIYWRCFNLQLESILNVTSQELFIRNIKAQIISARTSVIDKLGFLLDWIFGEN